MEPNQIGVQPDQNYPLSSFGSIRQLVKRFEQLEAEVQQEAKFTQQASKQHLHYEEPKRTPLGLHAETLSDIQKISSWKPRQELSAKPNYATLPRNHGSSLFSPRIQKPLAPFQPKPEQKPEPKPEHKAELKPDPKPELKPEQKAELRPEPKPELKPEQKPEPEQNVQFKTQPVTIPSKEPIISKVIRPEKSEPKQEAQSPPEVSPADKLIKELIEKNSQERQKREEIQKQLNSEIQKRTQSEEQLLVLSAQHEKDISKLSESVSENLDLKKKLDDQSFLQDQLQKKLEELESKEKKLNEENRIIKEENAQLYVKNFLLDESQNSLQAAQKEMEAKSQLKIQEQAIRIQLLEEQLKEKDLVKAKLSSRVSQLNGQIDIYRIQVKDLEDLNSVLRFDKKQEIERERLARESSNPKPEQEPARLKRTSSRGSSERKRSSVSLNNTPSSSDGTELRRKSSSSSKIKIPSKSEKGGEKTPRDEKSEKRMSREEKRIPREKSNDRKQLKKHHTTGDIVIPEEEKVERNHRMRRSKSASSPTNKVVVKDLKRTKSASSKKDEPLILPELPVKRSILPPPPHPHWAGLPQTVLFFLYHYTEENGISVVVAICREWTKFSKYFDNRLTYYVWKRFIAERRATETFLSAHKVHVSKKPLPQLLLTNTLDLDLNFHERAGADFRLTTPTKFPIKSLQKIGVFTGCTLSAKQQKDIFPKAALSFEFPRSFRFFVATVIIEGVPCSLGEAYPSDLFEEVQKNKDAQLVFDPYTLKVLPLLQLLYEHYFFPSRQVIKRSTSGDSK